MHIVNAGHAPPIVLADSPRLLTVPPIGPLGLDLPLSWQPALHVLRRPWSMFLHTDGLLEGRRSPRGRERFGIAGVLAQLELSGMHRERLLDDLLQVAEDANGAPLADDVSLLLLSCLAPSGIVAGTPARGEVAAPLLSRC
jgi:serine phosphatase RsbU (regulator of sigma subunit)